MKVNGGTPLAFLLICVSCCLAQESSYPQHLVRDWSSDHVIFTRLTPENVDAAVRQDPRALYSWLDHSRYDFSWAEASKRERKRKREPHHRKELQRDWQVRIGGASVGPRAYPAKFGFDINAAPDCSRDYVVFPTANPLSSGITNGSPSLVAFNNLYTGPGPSGICPTPTAPAAQPTVLFAYNTATVPSGESFANLSPVLSLDGTKVAFVETNAGSGGNYTAFHVLTWKAGEGTLNAAAFPGNCSAGNSCMTTLVLSTTSAAQNSGPYVDYSHDTAYVADGTFLHKITPVFNGTPAEVTGNGWPVRVSSSGSPVYDSVSQRVFMVGFSGVSYYLFVVDAASGATVNAASLGTFYIPSNLLVDSSDQTVFVFFSSSSLFLTATQFDTSGTLLSQVNAGPLGGTVNIYNGAFDHKYFSNPSTGTLYFAGAVNYVASLYGVGFTGKTMNTAASGPLLLSTSKYTSEPAPLTEIYNPTLTGSPDRLFLGIDSDCSGGPDSPGCIENFDISNGFPSGILNSLALLQTGGSFDVSGIIIDNVSSSPQASSIYFDAAGVAYKLTQSALQ
jgi:hypothetical protein